MKLMSLQRVGLVAVASLAVAVGSLTTHSRGASADTLLVESFTNSSVADAAAWESGGSGAVEAGWPGSTCLTAGGNTTQSPVPGCGIGSPDAAGNGALRLTPNGYDRAGFALYNKALPTTGGLDITFDQAQYGAGSYAADGISFFLVDGSTNLTAPGSAGGGLGYSAGNDGTNFGQGIENGLLGVGIDKWGNFSFQGSSGSGCADGTGPGSEGPGQTPNVVAVRGPGNGSAGYCWLAASPDLGNLLYGDNTRAGATVHVHIVVDPSTDTNPQVTVYLNDTQIIQIAEPQALLQATTFKFGFGGSTGAVTDIHEVWNLNINSVIPIPTTTVPSETTVPTVESTTTTVAANDTKTAVAATPISATPTYTG